MPTSAGNRPRIITIRKLEKVVFIEHLFQLPVTMNMDILDYPQLTPGAMEEGSFNRSPKEGSRKQPPRSRRRSLQTGQSTKTREEPFRRLWSPMVFWPFRRLRFRDLGGCLPLLSLRLRLRLQLHAPSSIAPAPGVQFGCCATYIRGGIALESLNDGVGGCGGKHDTGGQKFE